MKEKRGLVVSCARVPGAINGQAAEWEQGAKVSTPPSIRQPIRTSSVRTVVIWVAVRLLSKRNYLVHRPSFAVVCFAATCAFYLGVARFSES